MSWSAHEFELYVVQHHLGGRVSMFPLILGNYVPDMFTKWLTYGLEVGPFNFGVDDPAAFHRGWPGAGFTHSFLFGILVAGFVLLVTRSKVWGLSFLIAIWLQVVTDMADSLGTLAFWPFYNENIGIGVWAYAAQEGRYTDAGAYYSSLGFIMDLFWLLLALFSLRVLTKKYYREVVLANDPVMQRVARRVPETALLVLYRAAFFYGFTRLIAWSIWAHAINDFEWDLSWGGPYWVTPV